jgi:L-lactate dehydrogenase (cytochrome)
MKLSDCHNFQDFRELARRRLPSPIFHYIDGAADDEVTYRRNTQAYEDVDLVPNILAGVADIDMSVTVFGKKLDMPLYCAPTALQRLFHHEGERAVARAAQKFGTMFGVSSLGTVSVEEISKMIDTPKMFQYYFHKDRGLNESLLDRAKAAKFDVLALTVDTITGGNRERDKRTGFTSPPKLTPASLWSFATRPAWAWNYFTHPAFELPHLSTHVKEGSNVATSIGSYFSTMLDQSMSWKDAEYLCSRWNGHFALKGVMSVEDAAPASWCRTTAGVSLTVRAVPSTSWQKSSMPWVIASM